MHVQAEASTAGAKEGDGVDGTGRGISGDEAAVEYEIIKDTFKWKRSQELYPSLC